MFRPGPIGAAVGLLLTSGCGQHSTHVYTVSPPVAMPIGTVSTLESDEQCVYYKDLDTKDFYRVSLDGTVRERAVKGSKSTVVQLSPTHPSANAQGRVHIAGVPGGSGYTVLDVVSARPVKEVDRFDLTERTAFVANTDVPTRWMYKPIEGKRSIESGHEHEYWAWIVFRSGLDSRAYNFVSNDGMSTLFFGMADDNHAVLYDHPNVIVWNLKTDERTCIAKVEGALIWPRNLHKRERFTPIAKGGGKSWKVTSPEDVYPR